jgi:asparagine synthase (glutamine-hydrolysing)
VCGLVGILRRDGGPVDASAIDAMLDALRHRGPDDRGTWIEGSVALGHVRLGILDPTERSHQPMRTPDGLGVLVYNGEVYNFQALRRELEEEGVSFTSRGDTEVVLQALHRWGPALAVPRLSGMFAFAYQDLRDDSLWLARDRFGIKSLSVTEQNGDLLIASELKALLAHPAVTPRVDRGRLASALLYARGDHRESVFEGLLTIEPGTLHCVRGETTEVTRTHDLYEAVDVDRILAARNRTLADAVAATREALTNSVRLHLQSDAPLATMCSGGVDSSLITALAKDVRPEMTAYVADVGGSLGEYRKARRVADHLGVPLTRVSVDRPAFLQAWASAAWHLDAPSTHPSSVAELLVVRACRADGIKVLLTGEGADELFGGYSWYARSHARWKKARRLAGLPWPFGLPWRRRWKRLCRLPHGGAGFGCSPSMRRRLMIAVGSEVEVRRDALAEHLARIEPPEDRALMVHQLENLRSHLGWILHRHDRIAMAASVEARVPFLENDLADLALHLPAHLRLKGKTTKRTLKALAEERLPRDVVQAEKKGFPVIHDHWRGGLGLVADDGILPDLLHWSKAETAHILGDLGDEHGLRYRLTSLEIWGRLYLRNETVERVTESLLRACGQS